MRKAQKLAAVLVVALATSVALPATAQNGRNGGDPMLAEFEERNGNGILDEDIDSLQPAEMVERGEAKVAAMRVTLESTTELLERARTQERDIIKINCINENLASMKGFVNVGEQSYDSLLQSTESNDIEASRHHYTLVSIAGQRVSGLGEQARVCAGEELRFADDASLDVRIDPDIGSPDSDRIGADDVLERPPKVTPFQ